MDILQSKQIRRFSSDTWAFGLHRNDDGLKTLLIREHIKHSCERWHKKWLLDVLPSNHRLSRLFTKCQPRERGAQSVCRALCAVLRHAKRPVAERPQASVERRFDVVYTLEHSYMPFQRIFLIAKCFNVQLRVGKRNRKWRFGTTRV